MLSAPGATIRNGRAYIFDTPQAPDERSGQCLLQRSRALSTSTHDCILHFPIISGAQSAPGCSFVATGSEDGSVGIWDRRVNNGSNGANATFLKPTHVKAGDGNEGSPREGVGSDGEAWVSSLEVCTVCIFHPARPPVVDDYAIV